MENNNSNYPLLDIAQLEMLLESGDEESLDLVNEILELYREECQAKLSELKAAKENSDAAAFADASHAIAGSSANIGAATVWQKAKTMENHCKSGRPEDAYAMLDDIQKDFQNSLTQLNSFISECK